jgi:nucleoside 2-deoxyribosyltransferase
VALTIYFAGAISGGRSDVAHYRLVVDALLAEGHHVLAGAVAAEDVGAHGESLEPRAIFERDLKWLGEADVLVAEVSAPSIGVGYEIGAARYLYNIPVVCLYRAAFTKRCSAMVGGDREIVLIEYDDTERMLARLREVLQKYSPDQAGYARRRTPA